MAVYGNWGIELIGALGDLIRTQTSGANADTFGGAVDNNFDPLDIGLGASFCFDVRVAHQISGHRTFAADFAFI
jgi:hypothetical protein